MKGGMINGLPLIRLYIFALISLGLHAGLLMSWKTATPHFAGQTETVLSISLSFVEPPAQRPVKAAAPTRSRPHRVQPVWPQDRVESIVPKREALPEPKNAPPARQNEPEKHASTDPVLEPKGVTLSPSPESDQTPDGAITRAQPDDRPDSSAPAQVRALLLTDLKRHFDYPPLARRRGWEGVVWLSVTVKPDGMLDHILVTRSSGYAVLDRSAVAAMRRVGPLVEARHWFRKQALELSLPVIYRLIDEVR